VITRGLEVQAVRVARAALAVRAVVPVDREGLVETMVPMTQVIQVAVLMITTEMISPLGP
jgi:hypothetical protein